MWSNGPRPAAAARAPVELVEQKTVAGLDASVLRATEPNALAAWLKAHGYPSSTALQTWIAPYIKSGGYVTAFKIAGGAHAATRALRMSFTTDAPRFPYSEPAGNAKPRPFRVSIIAQKRMRAKLGDQEWKHVAYADALDRELVFEPVSWSRKLRSTITERIGP